MFYYQFKEVKNIFPGKTKKLREELIEFENPSSKDNEKEELIDLYFCVEVLMRQVFDNEIDINNYIKKVNLKNLKKGTYK